MTSVALRLCYSLFLSVLNIPRPVMSVISTPVAELFGIKYPVFLAGQYPCLSSPPRNGTDFCSGMQA